MKSLVDILVHILHDCGMMCGANPSRDITTVTRRTEQEGDSFLTITLPAFCGAFEKALASGSCSPSLFAGFRFQRTRCLPRFLGGFIEQVFGPDGRLLEEPSVDCILAIRQICLMFKKIQRKCSDARVRKAELGFLKCEKELKNHVPKRAALSTFKSVARIVWSDLLLGIPFGDPYELLRPRHGPGVTAEGLRNNQKFSFGHRWPSRLAVYFPVDQFGIGSLGNDSLLTSEEFSFLHPRDEVPSKVYFVPKTMKTPRVIAAEPVYMQYAQQALASIIVGRVEKSSLYTRGHVNFTDQRVNNEIALASSRDGTYATLDLTEASDRVSASLVRDMLACCPLFRDYVFACRTSRALLPSGKIIPLRKFASMGSALCFPIEAMVFFIAIISIRHQREGRRVTPASIARLAKDVYVYGDDIIVPTDEAPSIADSLLDFGLIVNRAKSFWTGKFRESCGVDAYDGHRVTPVYVRRDVPSDRTDVHGILSTVSLANQLYSAGYWRTCKALRHYVERHLGTLPTISYNRSGDPKRSLSLADGNEMNPGVGWISFSNAESHDGWDSDLQCLRSRRWFAVPTKQPDPLEGDAALLKCFSIIGKESSIDGDHLLTSVRSGNLALKRRWTPV